MKPRKLALRQESLADLTTDQLSGVAGASGIPTRCLCTGYYPSLNAPCTTPVHEMIQLTGLCD